MPTNVVRTGACKAVAGPLFSGLHLALCTKYCASKDQCCCKFFISSASHLQAVPAHAMYRSRMPSFPKMKPAPPGVNFTAYRLPATPSVDLSLFHDCPRSSVFSSVPLPPTAYPSLLLALNLHATQHTSVFPKIKMCCTRDCPSWTSPPPYTGPDVCPAQTCWDATEVQQRNTFHGAAAHHHRHLAMRVLRPFTGSCMTCMTQSSASQA